MSCLIFSKSKYDKNHWALCNDEKFIIRHIKENSYNFIVKLNPTDSRGYRTIVSYIGNDADQNIENTFNRKYTHEERVALLVVTSKICTCYEYFDLITQIEVAGNNSHQFINSNTIVGTKKEPSILHSHIICRGNPEYNYIGNVKLGGPIPGELFNMRNDKIKWSNENDFNVITKEINTIYDKVFG